MLSISQGVSSLGRCTSSELTPHPVSAPRAASSARRELRPISLLTLPLLKLLASNFPGNPLWT